MIKIGIFCKDKVQRKKIKNLINQYFLSLQIEAEIINIRTKVAALKDMATRYNDHNIIIICGEGSATYFRKNNENHLKSYSNITIGWLSMPIDSEKIENIIFNEDYHKSPNKVYKLKTNKTIRAIPYCDISFFRRSGDKTTIYLIDNETEEQSISIPKIKEELFENYFAECINGHLINLYNVRKIDKVNHELVMRSGHRIPISDRKYKEMVSLYIKVMFGI